MQNTRIKPSLEDSDSEDDYLGQVLTKNEESDDDFSLLSFGALSSAQAKLLQEEEAEKQPRKPKSQKPQKHKLQKHASHDSALDSEADFFEEQPAQARHKGKSSKKKSKHAPSESSSKRPVSRIREIPGLKSAKDSSLYTDIRFDAAYGKADWNRIRKDYAFLDEYRELEIKEMKSKLKNKQEMLQMSERDAQRMTLEMQSLKSRLDTLKNRDLANQIVSGHKKEQMQKMRKGEQVNPYFLKKSEQRKMIQKAKFDTLKLSQREKVMERKRKRRLGKEFRELEFRGQQ